MCGILFELCMKNSDYSVLNDTQVLNRIKNRGPDSWQTKQQSISDGCSLTFCGAVLWMRGDEITAQPLENDHGVLLYNGDIFDNTWDLKTSDTKLILDKLSSSKVVNECHIVEELRSLKGPFSIIYYDKSNQDLYFMRDRYGRNSLLFHKNDASIVISNVLGRKYKSVEIPATHIQIWNLKSNNIRSYPWDRDGAKINNIAVNDWLSAIVRQQSTPDEEFAFDYDENEDSTKINAEDVYIIQFIENAVQETKCKVELMHKLIKNTLIKEIVLRITKLLEESVKIRVEAQPMKCKSCLSNVDKCKHCAVGVLFSGGLDCTILALLADKYIPKDQSIHLMNVAFKRDIKGTYEVPDRITGKHSFEELKKVCPHREWILKEINITEEELETLQKTTIADLVYPRQTILDESLGSALWFAARIQEDISSRILLVGSGADELFGGYTRHRNAFKRKGWPGLDRELKLDWKRISFRNLARDNRVICDHGRQPRMPYLDEHFAEYVLKLKPWFKCFPSEQLGQGVGEKLMLRLVALHLGLVEVATFPKRALQFGTRIANKKEKGSSLSERLADTTIN